MADAALDSELIVLYGGRWPGIAMPAQDTPTDGFTGATHHNVVAAAYPIGTKIQVYNDSDTAGKPGFATFVYLQVGTQNSGNAIAAKDLVVPDSATLWYQVTNDPDSTINIGGLAAYAIAAVTDAYFGWFWCDGICPESFVSGLAGDYVTATGHGAGDMCAEDASTDVIGLGACSTAGDMAIGFALAAGA